MLAHVTGAGSIGAQEIITTMGDQKRTFCGTELISGGKYLGTIPNAALRLSFNTDNPHVGCFRGDILQQTDTTPPSIWQCISNNGGAESDWVQIGGGSGGTANTVLNGSGAPDSGLGNVGDFYIDTTAGAIYGPKTSGRWGTATSLVGLAGMNGTNGATWYEGSGVPSAGTGVNGDFYFRTSTGDICQKSGGAWGSPIANITGPQGVQGNPGVIGMIAANTLVGNNTASPAAAAALTIAQSKVLLALDLVTNNVQVKVADKDSANGVPSLDANKLIAVARLPRATANTLGVVQPGTGVSIDGNGVISFLSALAFLLSWFSFDNFEQYSVGANNVLNQGYSWAGSGSISPVENLSCDNMEAEVPGANNAISQGSGWAGNGSISWVENLSYDDMEAEVPGANNAISHGSGWAGNGSIAYI